MPSRRCLQSLLKAGFKGKGPWSSSQHKMSVQSGASHSCSQLKRQRYRVRQCGKTQNRNQDLSTSPLLFLWSLSSFAIRNFGTQGLYLSSFSLGKGERATEKFKFFPSRPRPPFPNPCTYKVMIFLSVSPTMTTTETQTLAVIYTSTHCCHNHLAARHEDMLFLLKVIFLTRNLPGQGLL